VKREEKRAFTRKQRGKRKEATKRKRRGHLLGREEGREASI